MAELSRHDRYSLPIVRRLTAPWRVLPNFVILGAQKAGTTTLYDNLVKHPSVHSCDIKEVHFFDTNWSKGENWYRAHFATEREKRAAQEQQISWITGEGSPYYMFHPLVAGRMKQVCPEARLIIILRDPVERAYSHYQHERRKGREPLSFENALADEEQRLAGEADRIISGAADTSFSHQHYSYKARGHYADQLEEWFRHFPREQFLILDSKLLNADFAGTLREVHNFLGIESLELPQPKRSNVGSYDTMDAKTKAELNAYFAPQNKRLFELLQRDFSWGMQNNSEVV